MFDTKMTVNSVIRRGPSHLDILIALVKKDDRALAEAAYGMGYRVKFFAPRDPAQTEAIAIYRMGKFNAGLFRNP